MNFGFRYVRALIIGAVAATAWVGVFFMVRGIPTWDSVNVWSFYCPLCLYIASWLIAIPKSIRSEDRDPWQKTFYNRRYSWEMGEPSKYGFRVIHQNVARALPLLPRRDGWGTSARNLLAYAILGLSIAQALTIVVMTWIIIVNYSDPTPRGGDIPTEQLTPLIWHYIFLLIFGLLAYVPPGLVLVKERLLEHPRFRRWFAFGRGGSARWAGPRSYAQRYANVLPRYRPNAEPYRNDMHWRATGKINKHIYLGETLFEDTFSTFPVLLDDDSHMLTIGCTGSGKSTTVLWPNLAMRYGSMLVLDPKGEHTRMTYWRRQPAPTTDESKFAEPIDEHRKTTYRFLSGHARVLDPFGQVPEIPSCHYNPLSEIDITSDRVRGILSGISDACVLPEDPKNQHFVDMAALFLEGVVAHVLSRHPKEDHTLPFVCDLLIGLDPELGVADPEKFTELLIEMRTNSVAGGIAQLAASKLDEMGANERGSVLSTLTRSVKWITDPAMRKHLAESDFSLADMAINNFQRYRRPLTVYVVLPFEFMKEQARWMRTITNVAISLIQNAPEPPEPPALFILDEFPMLGKMKKIEEGIVTLRSAGIKLWPLVQNIGQLKSTFGENWETFVSSSTTQLFGVNDLGTAKWASELLGKNLYQRQEKTGLLRKRVAQEQARELATPEEIIEELGKARPIQYIFPTSGSPMRLHRLAHKSLIVEGNRFKGLPLEEHFEE